MFLRPTKTSQHTDLSKQRPQAATGGHRYPKLASSKPVEDNLVATKICSRGTCLALDAWARNCFELFPWPTSVGLQKKIMFLLVSIYIYTRLHLWLIFFSDHCARGILQELWGPNVLICNAKRNQFNNPFNQNSYAPPWHGLRCYRLVVLCGHWTRQALLSWTAWAILAAFWYPSALDLANWNRFSGADIHDKPQQQLGLSFFLLSFSVLLLQEQHEVTSSSCIPLWRCANEPAINPRYL